MPLRYRILCFFFFLSMAGCIRHEEIVSYLDRALFQKFGTTVFINPSELSMKEIHLDGAGVWGKEVIIQGDIKEISDNFTYIVLEDDHARMLVVLTGVESAGPILKKESPRSVRILGVVENGQKGLPFLKARALNVIAAPIKA